VVVARNQTASGGVIEESELAVRGDAEFPLLPVSSGLPPPSVPDIGPRSRSAARGEPCGVPAGLEPREPSREPGASGFRRRDLPCGLVACGEWLGDDGTEPASSMLTRSTCPSAALENEKSEYLSSRQVSSSRQQQQEAAGAAGSSRQQQP